MPRDAALDRLVGEQWEPARRKVEVIAHIAGELRLWRVAGTNDSFRLTPSIFGPKMNGGYGAGGAVPGAEAERRVSGFESGPWRPMIDDGDF